MPILQESNFSGKGPAAVGSYRGLGPYGTYVMAGARRALEILTDEIDRTLRLCGARTLAEVGPDLLAR